MDVTPEIHAGPKLVQAYGDGGFTIEGRRYAGSLLLFPDRVAPWPVARIEDVTADSLDEVLAQTPKVEILLVGCGASFMRAPPGLFEGLRRAGIAVDLMDTGAACRTYNVLVAEARRVAAALVAVD